MGVIRYTGSEVSEETATSFFKVGNNTSSVVPPTFLSLRLALWHLHTKTQFYAPSTRIWTQHVHPRRWYVSTKARGVTLRRCIRIHKSRQKQITFKKITILTKWQHRLNYKLQRPKISSRRLIILRCRRSTL